MVQVRVCEGVLEGEKVENVYGKSFYSFKGIPYADPPVGDLRFKAPTPKAPWTGVHQATEHGPVCCQFDVFLQLVPAYNGEEDCLYLNVYTPNIEPQKPLPVMVFIHGGGFVSGSGNDDVYGPEFLVKHDVILVTLNYRLDVLGFLCLDIKDIPGNAGLKDQVAALRWVQNNIRSFGGDPDNVTIFGESVGATSVSLHLVSPMSKGLFKRAIMQSGTLLCPWAHPYEARDRALILAQELGCDSNDDKEIYEFLKNLPAKCLVKKTAPLTFTETAKLSPQVFFGVVSEKRFEGQESFLEGNVIDLFQKGIHEGVEVINGFTEDEGFIYFATGSEARHIFDQANKLIQLFVPYDLTYYLPGFQQMELGKIFKKYYLKDKLAEKERNVDELLKFFGMDYFIYASLAWQKICAKRNKNKIYLYRFSCKSERNIFARMIECEFIYDQRIPVSHVDDLFYIFPFKRGLPKVEINSSTYRMIEQVTKLWTNFAKYGNPTPDDSLDERWLPYTMDNQYYLDIGEKVTLGTSPNEDEMKFWDNIYRQYFPQKLLQNV